MLSNETKITPLNFSTQRVGHNYIDKKLGLNLNLGLVNALPSYALEYLNKFKGLALSLEEKGIGQELLDFNCQTFEKACDNHRLDVLITKNDSPLDNRWFWIGDLETVFFMAREDRILCPLSPFLYDALYYDIKTAKEKL